MLTNRLDIMAVSKKYATCPLQTWVMLGMADAHKHPARETRTLLKRLEELPEEVRKIAWKAQVRLCERYRKLMARSKTRNSVVTATARELSAFMWAIGLCVAHPKTEQPTLDSFKIMKG